jgi:DNA primase
MASAYSVRATPQATWSAPLKWEELSTDVQPQDFTMAGSAARVTAVGELWSLSPDESQRIESALPELERWL